MIRDLSLAHSIHSSRGAYCAAVTISLLNIPLDLPTDSAAYSAGHTDLLSGLGEWISRCEYLLAPLRSCTSHSHLRGQTYEGGVSAKPGTEAHGAYAFCALGCLSILDSPHRAVPRYVSFFFFLYPRLREKTRKRGVKFANAATTERKARGRSPPTDSAFPC